MTSGGNGMAEMKEYIRFIGGIRKAIPYLAVSLLGLMLLGNPVLAQDDTSSEEEEFVLEDTVVTGSILRNAGMEMPTPVTVMTVEELDMLSPTTLIEGLAELPQFFNSATTQQPSPFFESTGAGTLNLRGLQGKRTLQLLDGRRVVQSTLFGGPDINLFPEFLMKGIETVTGGASASYGTNAVAGAVNFILDTEYEGIKAKYQIGNTEKGYGETYEFQVAAGFALGDRTNILVSYEKTGQEDIFGKRDQYGWYDGSSLLPNPDTANRGTTPDNPYWLVYPDVRPYTDSRGGILDFTDVGGGYYIWDESAGKFVPYVMGDVCNAYGCSNARWGNGDDVGADANLLSPETGRENLFGYIEHNFTDNFKVFGQALYGEFYFKNRGSVGAFPNPNPNPFMKTMFDRAFTIYSGNPFLPADMQQLMDDYGMDSVKLGRRGSIKDLAFDTWSGNYTDTLSLTGGFEYEVGSGFFEGWQVAAYYQYGETHLDAIQHGGVRLDRIYIAADAVLDDQGNIVCNVTNTTNGELYPDCVPINLFGEGMASKEAIDWVIDFEPGVQMHAEGAMGTEDPLIYDYVSSGPKVRVVDIDQTVWDIRANGEIFEGWGAGPIMMGIGYGYREESFTQQVHVGPGGNINADPAFLPVMANDASLGIRGVPGGNMASGNLVEIQFSNVPHARGSQDVQEAFTEFLVPLVADKPGIKQMNVSLAGRWADYDGLASAVYSWKTGLSWSITDEIRLRGTYSQDVRAATMAEKFDRTGGVANVTDYLEDPTGGSQSTYTVTRFSGGSPDIQPEEAHTKTFGLIYRPDWLKGFALSADWYDVEIEDNINQLAATDVTTGCYLDGITDYCKYIIRGAGPSPINPDIQRISLIGLPYINQDAVGAKGVDFEMTYRRDVDWLGGGETINLRLVGSYLNSRYNLDIPDEIELARDPTLQTTETEFKGSSGFPEWTGVLTGTYRRGPLRLTATARYTDEMLLNRNWNYNGTSTRWDVLDNTIDARIIVNARANYAFEVFGGFLDVYGLVNNVFDKWPEQLDAGEYNALFGGDWGNANWGTAPNQDRRGRMYTFGLTYEREM
jgi:iron complex outermembrane receptor protein